jgi:hypothetical protein
LFVARQEAMSNSKEVWRMFRVGLGCAAAPHSQLKQSGALLSRFAQARNSRILGIGIAEEAPRRVRGLTPPYHTSEGLSLLGMSRFIEAQSFTVQTHSHSARHARQTHGLLICDNEAGLQASLSWSSSVIRWRWGLQGQVAKPVVLFGGLRSAPPYPYQPLFPTTST